MKVALSKCLKFLVVDTAATAEQCTDYLKEKGLFKELLVLENVPDRQVKNHLTKELKGEGHLVYDIIEVSRNFSHLDRAMRYFLADKVVCKDFDTAVKLQRITKDIITHDGTEFKQGMISGGTHKNIFGVNLGQLTLDRDIRKLTEEIGVLQRALADLTEASDKDINRVVQEVSKTETEIEIIKQKITDNERALKSFKDNSADSHTALAAHEKTLAAQDKELK